MTAVLSSAKGQTIPELSQAYIDVRAWSDRICQPLAIEDYVIQTMPDVSPPKWHLAHTTWFFETFLLQPYLPGYDVFHPRYGYLFNSYYEAVGDRHPRPERGLLARPTVAEIERYRGYVDQAMQALIKEQGEDPAIAALITLGLHHEQQHQELLVTDIKHIFANNPLYPTYRTDLAWTQTSAQELKTEKLLPLQWLEFAGGVHEIGFAGSEFHFDNEGPRHPVYVQ
ncbi:MAG: DinB family protein, partial [Cyanobacteria bacterium P01_H01_bin.121]